MQSKNSPHDAFELGPGFYAQGLQFATRQAGPNLRELEQITLDAILDFGARGMGKQEPQQRFGLRGKQGINLAVEARSRAAQQPLEFSGFFIKAERQLDGLGVSQDPLGQTCSVFAVQFFNKAMEIQQKGISAGSVLQNAADAGEAVIGEVCRGQLLVKALQEFPLRQHFEHASGITLMEDGGQLARLLVRFEALPDTGFEGRVQPALGALIGLEIQPHTQP